MNWFGIVGYVFVGLLGLLVLYRILTKGIDLSYLISESDGQASMSRFQLLVFTFVVAFSLLRIIESHPDKFPDIPSGILTLLGISASTYAVGKGIHFSREDRARAASSSSETTSATETKTETKRDEHKK